MFSLNEKSPRNEMKKRPSWGRSGKVVWQSCYTFDLDSWRSLRRLRNIMIGLPQRAQNENSRHACPAMTSCSLFLISFLQMSHLVTSIRRPVWLLKDDAEFFPDDGFYAFQILFEKFKLLFTSVSCLRNLSSVVVSPLSFSVKRASSFSSRLSTAVRILTSWRVASSLMCAFCAAK